MGQVSKPLVGLLVATVAFFALWMAALKPSSDSAGGSGGAGQYQPAINAAHAAVALSNRVSASQGADAPGAATRADSPATSTPSTPSTPAAATAHKPTTVAAASATHPAPSLVRHGPSTPHARLQLVETALREHKVLAMLFYNPSGSDDLAVRQELDSVPTHGGQVVKLALPVGELGSYAVVTTQVLVNVSPTLVIVDRSTRASTIVGFTDRFEIAGRIADALAGR